MKQISAFAVLMVLVFVLTSLADDLWYDAYESGMKAFQAGNLNQAERKFLEALKAQPNQGKRIKAYGTRFIHYVPDFYLGIVYVQQGRYQEALRQFEKAKRGGLIAPQDPEYRELLKYTRVAEDRLRPKPDEVKVEQQSDLNQKQREAGELLQTARELVVQGKLEEARNALNAALEKDPSNKLIVDLSVEITQKEAEIKIREEREKSKLQSDLLLQEAEHALARRDLSTARNLARDASHLAGDDRAAGEIMKRIELARNAAAPVPNKDAHPKRKDLELQALTAFYSADYHKAIELLEATKNADSARVRFYLGCSYAALSLLQRKDAGAALEKAKAHFAATRRLDRSFEYEARFISPRILRLYELTPDAPKR